MSKYYDKFNAKVNAKGFNTPGSRNNSLIAIATLAKMYELDESEFIAYVKNDLFGRDYTPGDGVSAKNAWREAKCDKTYSEWMAENGKNDNIEKDITYDDRFNKKFLTMIKSANVIEKPIEDRDTSILKYFFKDDDLIHIVSDKFDSCEEAKDVKSICDEELPMKKFELMSLATFKDFKGGRKNVNVKENRYVLLECDKLSLDMQKKFFFTLIEFGLPVKSITYSGGKSYHCLLKIHPTTSVEEYRRICETIHSELNRLHPDLVDKNNKDGVRYSRAPFGYRHDKMKTQEVIWHDGILANDEKYAFDDTVEQVKKFVGLFKGWRQSKPVMTDVNGIQRHHLMDSLVNCNIEDIFKGYSKYWIKLKDHELHNMSKDEIWNEANSHIDDEVKIEILSRKDKDHKIVKMDDFYVDMKDIRFEVTLKRNDNFYNLFEPGFITECIKMNVNEIPSEFDKLLDNIADKECKEWLLNHLACHFWLIMHDFKRDGGDFVLETIPVFYGMSGTGKNTFLDVIGQAISKQGTRYISIGNIGDDFNEYYMAGAVNVNEAANSKSEKRASKEALKRFTDKYQNINQKFMPKIRALNTAYKSISANEGIFGVLQIDEYDRRFQYITGGGQLNAKQNNVCDMTLLNAQRKEFIAYLLNRECDFDKAMTVFDNEAKIEDKEESLSNIEKMALWVNEHIEAFEERIFSGRTILEWYARYENEDVPDIDRRIFGKALKKYFGESTKTGIDIGEGFYKIKKNEMYFVNPHFNDDDN